MRRFWPVVLGILLLGALSLTAAEQAKPKENVQPLTPVFKENSGGCHFAGTYKNSTAGDVDLPALLQDSSIVLDGKVHTRQVVRFGGRSNLHPSESWPFTIDIVEYLDPAATLTEGRHTLALQFGGKEFGPMDFVWVPGVK